MSYKSLMYEVKEGHAVLITLNRPHKLNAFSLELREELMDALDRIEASREINAVVITGAPRTDGRPCFSSGLDLEEVHRKGDTLLSVLGTLKEGLVKATWAVGEQHDMWPFFLTRLYSFPKPTIAAIDGVCTAGGLELALSCDLRVAATTAQISDLHMKNLGNLGGGGLQTHLPRAVGAMKAKELIWLNEWIDGQEALRIGLVCRVFPPEELHAEALSIAHKLASHPPLAMKFSKMAIDASLSQGVRESLRFADLCHLLLRHMSPQHFSEGSKRFTKEADESDMESRLS
ncbi:enoyl-CoA hydratase/isomerase family protein [Chloroflexota bacterium]